MAYRSKYAGPCVIPLDPVPHEEAIKEENDFIGACDSCGNCCIGLSINTTLPLGRKFVKKAGERCIHLTRNGRCKVWGNKWKQPKVCRTIVPMNSLCRFDLRTFPNFNELHLEYLLWLDNVTGGGD